MPIQIDCFKAYDIRGQVPNQLNADIAYRIGNATAEYLNANTIVLGRDIRLSSDELADATARGINDAGAFTGRYFDPGAATTASTAMTVSRSNA